MAKRLLFVVNADWFFLSHRLPLALAAKKAGYEVHVAVGITDRMKELKSHGLIVHELVLDRGNSHLVGEFKSLITLVRIFRRVTPDIVHLVTIKPVLYGGIAAKWTHVPVVIAAISGLGYVFVAHGVKAAIRRRVVGLLYRIATSHKRLTVIFQNPTDQADLIRLVGLDEKKTVMIKGSGVDLQAYHIAPIPEGVPCVVMACRLIADKGVWQFVDAARLLKERRVVARFCLVGSIDPDNPTSLSDTDLRYLAQEGLIELWGYRSDMVSVMQQATIVALPSFYGEGLPKVLIEAAACGRPIVTTDMPGCREAVVDGVTGLLVPSRNSVALADAIDKLLSDRQRCIAMGKAGRHKAEAEFDLTVVVSKHLRLYESTLQTTPDLSG
jgi:glycosyltransferase involved in cell wall biosynthesis